ncbi:MAG: ribosome small subunit-dependent GTPase A [Silvanigrellales bacterium]|nr:ribosome small subunit-dependent GTPase A [Silvanigrellales bacterium]
MARGWRQFLDEPDGRKGKVVGRFEKMRKEKRSVRGRTVDDWIIDEHLAREAGGQTSGVEELVEAHRVAGGLRTGRVIEVHKRNVFVAEEKEPGKPDTGLLWLCSVAKRHFQRAHRERNFVVVGDRVLFEADVETKLDAAGDPIDSDLPRGNIQHARSRHSRIARRDPHAPDWEHVMLANIDLVCIVASVFNPEVRWGLIDRFLVQAELENLRPLIVLNKVDLLGDPKLASPEFLARYARRVAIYRDIGYEVVEVCALRPKKTPDAVKALRAQFRGKLVGLCGHSGVGKSSILNLMEPEFEQVVDENPEIFYKGRHTTTYNSLLTLGIGAYAIDTPGVRSFSIDSLGAIELSHCFPEFRSLARCKYRECSHIEEPGCAVKAAMEQGVVSKERYRSYLGILKGVSFREGEGDNTDAPMIADLKARAQVRDALLEKDPADDELGATAAEAALLQGEDDASTHRRGAPAAASAPPPSGGGGSLARRLALLKKKAAQEPPT